MVSSALVLPNLSISRRFFPALVRNATAAVSFRAPALISQSLGRSVTTTAASVTRNQEQQRQRQAPSSRIAQLKGRKAFSATPNRSRDHHFDTLKLVQRLKDEGFTEDQAVAMMKVLSDVIEER